MIVLTKSYGDAWRVFIPTAWPHDRHQRLAESCVWKGSDKTESFNGIECRGYEFANNWNAALLVAQITTEG